MLIQFQLWNEKKSNILINSKILKKIEKKSWKKSLSLSNIWNWNYKKNAKTSYLKNSWNRTVIVSCRNHVCLAPCAATHTYIAAMHIKKTTSNNKDDKTSSAKGQPISSGYLMCVMGAYINCWELLAIPRCRVCMS